MEFFKSLGQSLLIFNYLEAISKKLTALKRVNNYKNKKNQQKFYGIFKSLGQSLLKFNELEAISRELTTLLRG